MSNNGVSIYGIINHVIERQVEVTSSITESVVAEITYRRLYLKPLSSVCCYAIS